MALRANPTAWVTCLALSLAGACERAPLSASQQASAANSGGAEAATFSPLLQLMSQAPLEVLHGGTRHFQTFWTGTSGPQVLEYTEEVFADGLGNYSVTALDLIDPPSTPAEEIQFLFLQKLRQRMMFEVRDFNLRDTTGFLANYKLTDTGISMVVAGIQTVHLEIEQRVTPERRYLVDVDPNTGLILRSREELIDGTLVSKTEFTSLTYTPDLTNKVWSTPINSELELVPGSNEAMQELGFLPKMPKLIPDGWSLIGFAKLVDPVTNRIWARMTYSDGVELIFFVAGKGEGPGHQINPAASGPPPGDPDRVRKLAVGSWTLIEASLHKGDALVLGRAPDSVLYDLIQSAFF